MADKKKVELNEENLEEVAGGVTGGCIPDPFNKKSGGGFDSKNKNVELETPSSGNNRNDDGKIDFNVVDGKNVIK